MSQINILHKIQQYVDNNELIPISAYEEARVYLQNVVLDEHLPEIRKFLLAAAKACDWYVHKKFTSLLKDNANEREVYSYFSGTGGSSAAQPKESENTKELRRLVHEMMEAAEAFLKTRDLEVKFGFSEATESNTRKELGEYRGRGDLDLSVLISKELLAPEVVAEEKRGVKNRGHYDHRFHLLVTEFVGNRSNELIQDTDLVSVCGRTIESAREALGLARIRKLGLIQDMARCKQIRAKTVTDLIWKCSVEYEHDPNNDIVVTAWKAIRKCSLSQTYSVLRLFFALHENSEDGIHLAVDDEATIPRSLLERTIRYAFRTGRWTNDCLPLLSVGFWDVFPYLEPRHDFCPAPIWHWLACCAREHSANPDPAYYEFMHRAFIAAIFESNLDVFVNASASLITAKMYQNIEGHRLVSLQHITRQSLQFVERGHVSDSLIILLTGIDEVMRIPDLVNRLPERDREYVEGHSELLKHYRERMTQTVIEKEVTSDYKARIDEIIPLAIEHYGKLWDKLSCDTQGRLLRSMKYHDEEQQLLGEKAIFNYALQCLCDAIHTDIRENLWLPLYCNEPAVKILMKQRGGSRSRVDWGIICFVIEDIRSEPEIIARVENKRLRYMLKTISSDASFKLLKEINRIRNGVAHNVLIDREQANMWYSSLFAKGNARSILSILNP